MSLAPAGGIVIPPEYVGREQSYLKHLVLEEYLEAWSHKLGSAARYGRSRLWYVDTFAGPWEERHPDLRDTSFAIALAALRAAANTWAGRGIDVEVSAIFVERNTNSFSKLREYLGREAGIVRTQALHGEFGDHAQTIRQALGNDAAFVFVDPTGWKGAAMRYIAPLVEGSAPRDVMINVMYEHLNRQKDRDSDYIREQMRDFFGLQDYDLPPELEEEQLFSLYRKQLKSRCGLSHAADLSILHPKAERTKFRLVIGGKSPKVLEVFRDVESKVIGRIAGQVRDEVRHRDEVSQQSLFAAAPSVEVSYARQHESDYQHAKNDILASLSVSGATFEALWPPILERRHMPLSSLRRAVLDLERDRSLRVTNRGPRERTIRPEHHLSLVARR